jgi:hypothetical protein
MKETNTGKGRIMSRYCRQSTAILALLCILIMCGLAPAGEKPRIVVMTDIGGDPDDMQSMVRFLLYSCDFDVEGLCTGFGHGHYKKTRPTTRSCQISENIDLTIHLVNA